MNYTTTRKLGGLAAGVLLGIGLLVGNLSQSAQAHGNTQHATITISEKGYSPASINFKSGHQAALNFISKGGGCANYLGSPALKQNFTLK